VKRSYSFDAPEESAGEVRPLPLVFALHPLLLNGSQMRVLSGFEKRISRERPFVVVYPSGIGNSWNAGECCGDGKTKQIDDVGFVRRVLEDLTEEFCIDETRVYATGFSNGGFLAHRLACEMSDSFTAIAAVAGTLGIPGASCNPSRAVPVLQIHGTEDALVPIAGGAPKVPFGSSFGTFQAPRASVDVWREKNRCGEERETFAAGVTRCVASQCAEGTAVEYCEITGGGHQWPGTEPLPAMGRQTKDLHATDKVLSFLFSHALP
jgi:polyhydroxybutyrate depolymerase